LTLETWAWVGIGWHAPGSDDSQMTNGDFIIATFDSSFNGKVGKPTVSEQKKKWMKTKLYFLVSDTYLVSFSEGLL
jgi:hypothetical protein